MVWSGQYLNSRENRGHSSLDLGKVLTRPCQAYEVRAVYDVSFLYLQTGIRCECCEH